MTLMYPLLSLFGDLTALCDRFIKAQLQLQHINNLPKVRAPRHLACFYICKRCRAPGLEVAEATAAMLRNGMPDGG